MARAVLAIRHHEDKSGSESASLEHEREAHSLGSQSLIYNSEIPKARFWCYLFGCKTLPEGKNVHVSLQKQGLCGRTAMPSLCGGCQELSYKHWVTLLQSQKISVQCSAQGSADLPPV